MLQIYKDLELDIPSDVTVEIHARNAKVKGPRGELEKVSSHPQSKARLKGHLGCSAGLRLVGKSLTN